MATPTPSWPGSLKNYALLVITIHMRNSLVSRLVVPFDQFVGAMAIP